MSTSTEAIIAAATSAEAAAAVAQEQGATLVTVHPAVIEAPVDVAEGQGNEGEENEGDGMGNNHFCIVTRKFLLQYVAFPVTTASFNFTPQVLFPPKKFKQEGSRKLLLVFACRISF